MKSVLLFCAVLSVGYAQKIGFGNCPQTTKLDNFDVGKYLGRWYEIAKIPAVFQSGTCTEANYGPIDEAGRVTVVNKELRGDKVTGVQGFARQKQPFHSDLTVSLRVPIAGMQDSAYDVLATDYTNYALVHACRSFLFGTIKFEFAWILSRTRIITPEILNFLDVVMDQNGVDKRALKPTVQENCPNFDNLPTSFIA